MIRSWTDEQLQEAVRTSYSYCEVVKGHILKRGLSTSHFRRLAMLLPLQKRNATKAPEFRMVTFFAKMAYG